MSQTLHLGPLVIPYALLVVLAAVALAAWSGRRLAGPAEGEMRGVIQGMAIAGVMAARVAYVWQWRTSYLEAPWSIIDIRDGGWNALAGLLAAAIFGLAQARRRPALRRAVVGAVLAGGLVWAAGTVGLSMLPRPERPLPALVLASIDGAPVALPSLRGRPTVINLWATWCPPCRREMPMLQRAQAEATDVHFIFVSQGERPEVVARFLRQQSLALRHVLIDPAQHLGAAFGLKAMPTTLFFDAGGRLVSTRVGELSRATLDEHLARARSSPMAPR